MEDVLAVLVLYKVKFEDCLTCKSLNNGLKAFHLKLDILVYDNTDCCIEEQSDFSCFENFNVIYKSDILNPGVSQAYNFGANYAVKNGKKWLLLLDQDTIFPIESIKLYLEAILMPNQASLICPVLYAGKYVVSPCRFFLHHGSISRKIEFGVTSFDGKMILNSGLMVQCCFFTQIGGYNNSIPLDFSDFYFIQNAKKSVDSFYVLPCLCEQNLSSFELDKNRILNRFKYYCLGMYEYRRKGFSYNFVLLWGFIRTFFLAYNFRELSFFKFFFRYRI